MGLSGGLDWTAFQLGTVSGNENVGVDAILATYWTDGPESWRLL